jgi:hypothetical protein
MVHASPTATLNVKTTNNFLTEKIDKDIILLVIKS